MRKRREHVNGRWRVTDTERRRLVESQAVYGPRADGGGCMAIDAQRLIDWVTSSAIGANIIDLLMARRVYPAWTPDGVILVSAVDRSSTTLVHDMTDYTMDDTMDDTTHNGGMYDAVR
jgi:hypothetical protein